MGGVIILPPGQPLAHVACTFIRPGSRYGLDETMRYALMRRCTAG
jgi:hypothetical protein